MILTPGKIEHRRTDRALRLGIGRQFAARFLDVLMKLLQQLLRGLDDFAEDRAAVGDRGYGALSGRLRWHFRSPDSTASGRTLALISPRRTGVSIGGGQQPAQS